MDAMLFGWPTRYLQLDPRCAKADDRSTWDMQLYETAHAFQRQSYDFLMWNCHSFLASFLNRTEYPADTLARLLRGWTVAGVAARLFFSARYVGAAGFLQSWAGNFGIWIAVLLCYWWTGSAELLVRWLWVVAGVNGFFIGWFLLVTACGLHSQWGVLHAEKDLVDESDEDGEMGGLSRVPSSSDDLGASLRL